MVRDELKIKEAQLAALQKTVNILHEEFHHLKHEIEELKMDLNTCKKKH